MPRKPSGMVQIRAKDSTVRQESSHRCSRLERDQEAPIMEMLKHLPFCKKPKVARQGKSAPDHSRLVPASEKSDSYQLPWRKQPASHQVDSKEEVRHRRRVKPIHHTTLFTPVIATLATYQDHLGNFENIQLYQKSHKPYMQYHI